MTKRFHATLLIALLALSLLTGCGAQAIVNPQAAVNSQTELPEQIITAGEAQAEQPEQIVTAGEAQAEVSEQILTPEEAQAIALKHAGFTTDQVLFLRTEPELLDREPHYDVEFQEGPWEYDYEIHAETGEILSFEKDD